MKPFCSIAPEGQADEQLPHPLHSPSFTWETRRSWPSITFLTLSIAPYEQVDSQIPHPQHKSSFTLATVASDVNLSFEIIVNALDAAPYDWEILSLIDFGECAIPARKTPSVAKSTGLS